MGVHTAYGGEPLPTLLEMNLSGDGLRLGAELDELGRCTVVLKDDPDQPKCRRNVRVGQFDSRPDGSTEDGLDGSQLGIGVERLANHRLAAAAAAMDGSDDQHFVDLAVAGAIPDRAVDEGCDLIDDEIVSDAAATDCRSSPGDADLVEVQVVDRVAVVVQEVADAGLLEAVAVGERLVATGDQDCLGGGCGRVHDVKVSSSSKCADSDTVSGHEEHNTMII